MATYVIAWSRHSFYRTCEEYNLNTTRSVHIEVGDVPSVFRTLRGARISEDDSVYIGHNAYLGIGFGFALNQVELAQLRLEPEPETDEE